MRAVSAGAPNGITVLLLAWIFIGLSCGCLAASPEASPSVCQWSRSFLRGFSIIFVLWFEKKGMHLSSLRVSQGSVGVGVSCSLFCFQNCIVQFAVPRAPAVVRIFGLMVPPCWHSTNVNSDFMGWIFSSWQCQVDGSMHAGRALSGTTVSRVSAPLFFHASFTGTLQGGVAGG